MSSSRPIPNLTLYTSQTPNGIKISITLAELGLPYTTRKIDMTTNEQKSDWFTAINPNGRIPALTDTHTDGKEIRIFESGSIMQYLVDRYDTEHPLYRQIAALSDLREQHPGAEAPCLAYVAEAERRLHERRLQQGGRDVPGPDSRD